MAYSSAGELRRAANVKPDELGFQHETNPEDALDTWLDARLEEISDLIDRHIAEKYQGAEAPPGIHGIARQMGQNLIANVRSSRTQSVVRISDWRVQIEQARVFTDDVKDSLALYQERNPINIFRVPGYREWKSAQDE